MSEAATAPVPLSIVGENIPSELRKLAQWVVWKWEERETDGKPTKVPYCADRPEYKASTTNQRTWATYSQALHSFRIGKADGVGFVFNKDDAYCGIDLDKCRNPETGEIKPWAQRIIDNMRSYCEVSPSTKGVKIWVKAKLPSVKSGRRDPVRADGKRWNNDDAEPCDGEIEMYHHSRFFAVTSERLEDGLTTVEPRQEEVDALYREVFGDESEPVSRSNGEHKQNRQSNGQPLSPSEFSAPTFYPAMNLCDAEILEVAMRENGKDGSKFKRLWNGEVTAADYPKPVKDREGNPVKDENGKDVVTLDESSADFALCIKLAWYMPDPERIDRLFRQSKLCRDKWTQREDYRRWTIENAIAFNEGKVYNPLKYSAENESDSEQVTDNPPSSPDVENKFLACVFRDPTILDDCKVDGGHFAGTGERIIFLAIRKTREAGHVDPVTVGQSLSDDGKLDEVGGNHKLAELWNSPTTAGWRQLFDVLERKRSHRDLFYFARSILRDSEEFPGVESLEGHRDHLERIIKRASGLETKKARTVPFMTSAEFSAADLRHEFAVRGILVKGQPCVIGGHRKCLKTNIGIDLALSLAFQRYFLGAFQVDNPGRVLFLSGESGASTIKETASRIAIAKGVTLPSADILWGFELPQLSKPEDIEGVRRVILDEAVNYVIIDPLYLCLLGSDATSNASNLFAMGTALLPLTEIATETGATIVVMHHLRKKVERDLSDPPELSDLAFSGVAEWARQWFLIGRREIYEPGTGMHKLWLSVGGSAGHNGLWGLDIEEGQAGDHLGGRCWEVDVDSAKEARQDAKDEREAKKAEAKARTLTEHRDRFLEALKSFPEGGTKTAIREAAGLNSNNVGPVVAALLKDNLIEPCDVPTARGTKDGYRLKTPTPDGRTTKDNAGQDNGLSGVDEGRTVSPIGGAVLCPTSASSQSVETNLFNQPPLSDVAEGGQR